jgi:hypothetical protein
MPESSRPNPSSEPAAPSPAGPRPFLGLHMRCCHVYVRVYANAAGDAFVGRCPRCGVPVRVDVDDEGGSTGSFFSAG